MNILYLFDKGYNSKVLDLALEALDAEKINIKDAKMSDLKDRDVIIYQTFPDEFHEHKFDSDLIEKTDRWFTSANALVKILFDAHDSGSVDSFTRFEHLGLPMIKLFMTEDYPHTDQVIFQPEKQNPQVLADFIDEKLSEEGLDEEIEEEEIEEEPKPKLKKKSYRKKSYRKKR